MTLIGKGTANDRLYTHWRQAQYSGKYRRTMTKQRRYKRSIPYHNCTLMRRAWDGTFSTKLSFTSKATLGMTIQEITEIDDWTLQDKKLSRVWKFFQLFDICTVMFSSIPVVSAELYSIKCRNTCTTRGSFENDRLNPNTRTYAQVRTSTRLKQRRQYDQQSSITYYLTTTTTGRTITNQRYAWGVTVRQPTVASTLSAFLLINNSWSISLRALKIHCTLLVSQPRIRPVQATFVGRRNHRNLF